MGPPAVRQRRGATEGSSSDGGWRYRAKAEEYACVVIVMGVLLVWWLIGSDRAVTDCKSSWL